MFQRDYFGSGDRFSIYPGSTDNSGKFLNYIKLNQNIKHMLINNYNSFNLVIQNTLKAHKIQYNQD